ncbi:MAG TPA: NAD(P)H-dependent glycerol-3-phosphate dehydrogenase, partial [Hansschlegelia sp.]
ATGERTALIGRDPARMAEIAKARVNAARLPDIALHQGVHPTADRTAVSDADIVLLVVPTQTLRSVCAEFLPLMSPGAIVVTCCKGVEQVTLALPHEVLRDALPDIRHAILSGPSFAEDVALGLPTAVTLASHDENAAILVTESLATRSFRPYRSHDMDGAALGGAAKNVLAIAAGAVAGRGLGASAVAAMVARGFAELARLGLALGAKPETLAGLSGLGDLVLTTSSTKSRNFSLGLALGRGEPPPNKLAEGAATVEALIALAARHEIDMPISAAVADVLSGRVSVGAAVANLLARPLRAEV